MKQRITLFALMLLMSVGALHAADARPNIILIFADDWGERAASDGLKYNELPRTDSNPAAIRPRKTAGFGERTVSLMQPDKNCGEQKAKVLARALSHTRYHEFPGGLKKLKTLVRLVQKHGRQQLRVLDVGCGNGNLAYPLASLGCEVLGVDVHSGSVDSCCQSNPYPQARFLHTCGDLSEVDGNFDLIVCSEVLEHLDDPDALLDAMADKLAPGGTLFITIPNGYGLREVGSRCEKFIRRKCGLDRPMANLRRFLSRFGMPSECDKQVMHTFNPFQEHVQKFTKREIEARLRRADFAVTAWTNSFWILSVFHCRSGQSWVERFDSWLADRLPPVFASGWYLSCQRTAGGPQEKHGETLNPTPPFD